MKTMHSGLPIVSLLALSTIAFLTILTETMPAAVLPLMVSGLNSSTEGVGMLVGVYAIGAAAAAIPLVTATRNLPRRMLLVSTLLVFCVANLVTASTSSYIVMLVARLIAGMTSGIVWPMVAGYAVRLAAGKNEGRAISIAVTGSAVAMAIGLPLGSHLGELLGWRASFGLLALVALGLIGWVMVSIPAVSATPKEDRTAVHRVALLPGLLLVLGLAGIAMLGHYSLYTYMAPLASGLGLYGGTTAGLLFFGAGAIISVVAVGPFVDRYLRQLAVVMIVLTALSMILLTGWGQQFLFGQIGVFLWGVSFGGMPTIIQTAASRIARSESELATAMIATIYNVGIFGGCWIGGIALASTGLSGVICIVVVAMAASLMLVLAGKRFAFPNASPARRRGS